MSTTTDTTQVEATVYKSLGSSIGRKTQRREITSWFAAAAAVFLLGSLGTGRLVDLCDMVDTSILYGGAGQTGVMDGKVGDEKLTLQQLEAYYDFLGGRSPARTRASLSG